MHTIKNMIRKGILCLFPLFTMTACSGKEEIVFEQDTQDERWESQSASEALAGTQDSPQSTGAGGEADTALAGGEAGAAGGVADYDAVSPETLPENMDKPASPGEIYVHICGAVVNPGVYALATGSRIFEGIEIAGGFREDACEDYVNLAKTLQDGQRIVIPTMEEVEAAGEDDAYHKRWMTEADTGTDTEEAGASVEAAQGVSTQSDGLININLATESELSSINGIGAGKAAAIVKYRQEIGGFTSIEEIMEVSGIGQGIYEKIKDKITVR
ncbi:MAG: helix-hairpin-helix domain-containing protein [Muribaculaceae bacterium]|nr:helix-hairpin-helix domain-containing protein [Muribaculaceae bacterium]